LIIHPVERLCSWPAAAVAAAAVAAAAAAAAAVAAVAAAAAAIRPRNSSNPASILAVHRITREQIASRAACHPARHRHPRVHPPLPVGYLESLRDDEHPTADPDYCSISRVSGTRGRPSKGVSKVRPMSRPSLLLSHTFDDAHYCPTR